MSKRYNTIIFIVSFILIISQAIPYIIAAVYTFPLQDDFYNTGVLLEEMRKSGRGILGSSLALTVHGFTEYRGYYFSLFLIYLTDGITLCDVFNVRLLLVIVLAIHYVSLVVMIYSIASKVFKLSNITASVTTVAVFTCFTGLFYFVNNETLYWLCAVAVYQIPCTVLYLFTTIYIRGVDNEKKISYILCSIMGFLIGGSSVNVAALACIIACQLIFWGCYVKKKYMYSIICGIPVVLGSLLNVLAPGNYRGEAAISGSDKLIEVIKGAILYEYDRMKMYICEYPIFIFIIILIVLSVLLDEHIYKYKFHVPVIYTVLLVMGEMATIIPTQWASGVEAYSVYERCIIVSDWTSFLLVFCIVFYLAGWFKNKLSIKGITDKKRTITYLFVLSVFCIVLFLQGDKNAGYRLTRELAGGDVQAYGNWAASIIDEVKNSDEQIVNIYTKEVKDTTCMANAFYNIGIYDPEMYVGNSALGNFYGKRAIYILEEE